MRADGDSPPQFGTGGDVEAEVVLAYLVEPAKILVVQVFDRIDGVLFRGDLAASLVDLHLPKAGIAVENANAKIAHFPSDLRDMRRVAEGSDLNAANLRRFWTFPEA